ncbi:MAG: integrase [Clostridiales bacterium]|nr:integrase [Clostridiales bacterium]
MAEKTSYREQADQRCILQMREIAKGLPPACGDFFRNIAMTTRALTRLAYALDLRTFFEFLQTERLGFHDKPLTSFDDRDLERVSQRDLAVYVEYLTYYVKSDESDGDSFREFVNHDLSIKRKLCAVRSFYSFLFRSERISSNVTDLVPLPKIHEKPIIRLSQPELRKMLEQAATGEGLTEYQQRFQKITAKRDFAMLSLFLGTGIRVSECVGLNIDDIDLDENAFLVTRKGGNQAVLYFPPEVAEALADYMEQRKEIEPLEGHENALFLSMQRRRITQRAVQKLVKKYAAIAAPLKPRISPHKLRSTFGTNLYHATGDIYLVADVLGHSSVDTTRKHYADMTQERRQKAAEYVHLPDAEGNISADNEENMGIK